MAWRLMFGGAVTLLAALGATPLPAQQASIPARHRPPVHAQPLAQWGEQPLAHWSGSPPAATAAASRPSTRAEAPAAKAPHNPLRSAPSHALDARPGPVSEPDAGVRTASAQQPIDDPFGDAGQMPSVLQGPIEPLAPPANWRAAESSSSGWSGQQLTSQPTRQPATSPAMASRIPARQTRQDDPRTGLLDLDCDQIRQRLLEHPITDIEINISPSREELDPPHIQPAPTRTWTDRFGRVLGSGKLVDVIHGYAVIDDQNGRPQRWALSRLSEPDLAAIADYWRVPVECTLGLPAERPRIWVPQTVTWKASALCHKPLYFEDVQLERYGHEAGPWMQPLRSTKHFFTRLVFLPYLQGINPPNECQYALGYYRPGNCAPWLVDPIPISARGAAMQGAAYTGGSFLLGR